MALLPDESRARDRPGRAEGARCAGAGRGHEAMKRHLRGELMRYEEEHVGGELHAIRCNRNVSPNLRCPCNVDTVSVKTDSSHWTCVRWRPREGAVPMSDVELPGSDPVERHHDDLDDFLEEELRDPEFRGAYDDAMARSALLRALVSRRGDCQLSQADVAALMGTTQSAVSDLERGATDPRLSTLQRFARAVHCSLHLTLHVDHQPARSWRVESSSQAVWSAIAPSPYWGPLLEQVAGTGRTRPSALSASANTSVAPVAMRGEPDEFVRAVAK